MKVEFDIEKGKLEFAEKFPDLDLLEMDCMYHESFKSTVVYGRAHAKENVSGIRLRIHYVRWEIREFDFSLDANDFDFFREERMKQIDALCQ